MLHTISWGEYFTVMGLGFLLYYGWWLVRFYPTLRWVMPAWLKKLTKKVLGAKVETTAVGIIGVAGEVIGKPDQAVPAQEQATQQEELPLPVPAVIQKPVLMPVLALDLANEVRRLMDSVSDGQLAKPELVSILQRLLSTEPYCTLHGTAFESRIVEQIVGELEKHGLIAVDAMTVSGWWT